MPKVPTSPSQTVGPSAPRTRAAPTVFQQVRGATADAFGAAEGRALREVGQALGGEAERLTSIANKQLKAEARIQSRRAALDRLKREGQLSTDLFDLSTATSEQDISDPNVLKSAGMAGQDVVNRSVEALRATGASEEEVLLYEATAQETFNIYRDTLAKKSVAVAKGLTDNALDTEVKKGAAEAGEEPEKAFIIASEGAEKALLKLGALVPEDQEKSFAIRYQDQVFQSAINSLLAKGNAGSVQEALTMMEHPRVKAIVGADTLRKIVNRASNINKPFEIMSEERKQEVFNLPSEQAKLLTVTEDDKGITMVLNRIKDPDVRAKRIEDATKSLIESTGVTEDVARDRATNVLDGNIERSQNRITGEEFERDKLKGTMTLIKKANPAAAAQAEDESQRGIYQEILDTPTSGIVPSALELFVETAGQISGIPIPEVARRSLTVRQNLLSAQKGLVQAFSLNPRFPAALVKLIEERTALKPAVLVSDRALLIRMVAIAKFLREEVGRRNAIFDDPNNPPKLRATSRAAAIEMENFLKIINVPEDADPLAPEDPPIQVFTIEQRNALPEGTPYFDPFGRRRRTTKGPLSGQ